MPPFRNLLGRKPQPNGVAADGFDENHLSPHPRPGSIPMRRSCDSEPNEYKLSGESTYVVVKLLQACDTMRDSEC